jgi:DNA helicase II / ATP-dependent DNA helicase PcrA
MSSRRPGHDRGYGRAVRLHRRRDIAGARISEAEARLKQARTQLTRRADLIQLEQIAGGHGQHAYGDRHVYASRTRLIPDRLLGQFEKTVWPRGSQARAASQGPRIDVGARMRGMWR